LGDCYFMKNYTNYRGEIKQKDSREDLIISSEDIGCVLEPRHPLFLINGSYGIWFYESDLWNKQHLKEKLLELVNELDKFQADGKDITRCIEVKEKRFKNLRKMERENYMNRLREIKKEKLKE